MITPYGTEHGLGGVAGYDFAERVAAVQRLSRAYLRSHLYPSDPAWSQATAALSTADGRLGRLESK